MSEYEQSNQGIVWNKPTGDDKFARIVLTNFSARIIEDVSVDNGLESLRNYVLVAQVGNRPTQRFEVSASDFGSLDWVPQHLGSAALVSPERGVASRTAHAIQSTSNAVELRRFGHTGWRRFGDRWVYLHGNGHICPECPDCPDFGEKSYLNSPFDRVSLELPSREELEASARSLLDLVEVAPARVIVPLLAASFLVVGDTPQFSVFLFGTTGSFKTAIATTIQQFFGRTFGDTALPANWSSTENALEECLFTMKDCVCVIDDFVPGTGENQRKLQSKAERVLRAQGNRSGRQRMTSNGALRAARPPRGICISTGEDLPIGASLVARSIVIRLSRKDVNIDALSRAQAAAARGDFERFMAEYVRYVACARRDGCVLPKPPVSKDSLSDQSHARSNTVYEMVRTGWTQLSSFLRTQQLLSEDELDHMTAVGDDGIVEAFRTHQQRARISDIAERFIELVRSALMSNAAYLAPIDGNANEPLGDETLRRPRIGWVSKDEVLLNPDTSLKLVKELASGTDEPLHASRQSIGEALRDRGLIQPDPDGHTAFKRTIRGTRMRVFVINRTVLLPPDPGALGTVGTAEVQHEGSES